MLLLCICSPMVVNWFLAFMKILFSGKDWPSLPTFLVVRERFVLAIICLSCALVCYRHYTIIIRVHIPIRDIAQKHICLLIENNVFFVRLFKVLNVSV